MKVKFVILFLLCSTVLSYAQVISPNILEKYSPGVIARLYDFTKNLVLTEGQQAAIAEKLKASENSLLNNIKQGKSYQEIDSIQRYFDGLVIKEVGKEMLLYTQKKAENFARSMGESESQYFRTEFGLDSVTAMTSASILYNKYKRLYQTFLLYGANNKIAMEKMTEVFSRYDSLDLTLWTKNYHSKILETYLSAIKNARTTIPDSLLNKVKNYYVYLISKNPFADCGKALLTSVQNIYPDTAIISRLYKNEISREASYLLPFQQNIIFSKLRVTKDAYVNISPLVNEKLYKQVLYEYTYAANLRKRDSIIYESGQYYDSLITRYVLRDGSLLSSNQFSIALKYKKVIGIDPKLTDTLLYHAMYLTHLQDSIVTIKPFAKTDFKAYEAAILGNLLTDAQYSKLLAIKNDPTARMNAEDDWEDMVLWNISGDYNKEETLKELFNFYMAKWISYYKLANDKIKQEANQKVIKDSQPRALKALSAAKKLPAPANANTNLQLKW